MTVAVVLAVISTICFMIIVGLLIWANVTTMPRDPWVLLVIPVLIIGIITSVVSTLNYSNKTWEEYLVSKKHGMYAYHESTGENSSPSNQSKRFFQLYEMSKK